MCDKYVKALESYDVDIWHDRKDMQDGRMLSDEIEFQLAHQKSWRGYPLVTNGEEAPPVGRRTALCVSLHTIGVRK
jgi:hypothetical protein